VAVVALGYRREQVGHPADGFGFLAARTEGLRVLGCVWNSSLFPGRAPAGMVNFTSFAGGATDPEVCEWTEERIAETVGREIGAVLKINGPPAARLVWRHRRALPQYNLSHSGTIAALRNACARFPGLFLTGNYLEGPAIGTCVEQAFRTADSVRSYLETADEAGGAQETRSRTALESR
jgi:oxygen-dependent protoporphyrinogen oxidase